MTIIGYFSGQRVRRTLHSTVEWRGYEHHLYSLPIHWRIPTEIII